LLSKLLLTMGGPLNTDGRTSEQIISRPGDRE